MRVIVFQTNTVEGEPATESRNSWFTDRSRELSSICRNHVASSPIDLGSIVGAQGNLGVRLVVGVLSSRLFF